MSTFTEEHLLKMQEGLRLFNQQHYWECHEALEDCWLEDAHDPVRNVYWAIIQVAAGLIHYEQENLVGASSLIRKAQEKVLRCSNLGIETPLLRTKVDWEQFKFLVLQFPEKPQLEDFVPLWNFRFTHFEGNLKEHK